ncbi:acetyl-CoA carboxylase biotin carboxyl carrier protein [Bartonella australis AUST/NH1]|uniref:Biotin carboxyl carrier protein of acetyl-CoA carboxylase n=1 Tax=Bartonella australis (strain Aust/NH1) TaxID=1094489 RepID=M1PD29_BARAA|nr:acetyl-CoA carboxylase biotin carboxyl carrier protein [Bartonella australis]AGF74486.1 acetyl-CoA carboxylase biotin carboxyl carrier protein [Bartonella australis AUST/NH1]
MTTKKVDTTKHTGISTEIIRDLAEILNDTNLTNIELEQGGLRICVSRQHVPALPEHTIHVPVSPPTIATPSSSVTAAPKKEEKSENAVTSPMVGTAYLAPAPGAQSFVQVGQTVSEGQTLLIIEAMKTMNHIASPRSGVVTAVFVKDGQPVEFGEPLVVVE